MHDPEFLIERKPAEYAMGGGRRVVLTEHVTAFHRAEQRNDVAMIYNVNASGWATGAAGDGISPPIFFPV